MAENESLKNIFSEYRFESTERKVFGRTQFASSYF
jgi:hypothetical protein